MEFIILKAWRGQFPNGYGQYDFTQDKYNNIREYEDLEVLRLVQFSNIKVVSSIVINELSTLGWAKGDCQPCMVLTWAGVAPYTVVHEYGHMIGLLHRGTTAIVYPCDVPNPGSGGDTTALMHNPQAFGSEVNRRERDRFHTVNIGYVDY
jgi:hypothetical protein